MSSYKKEGLYPGEMRIITALCKQPLTFTQLIKAAPINRVTLSEYLKRLTKKHIVEHDKATRKYSFPLTFQPLLESSFPDEGFLQIIRDLIKTSRAAKRVWGSQNMEPQNYLFKILLHAFNLELNLALSEASCYENLAVAHEYISNFSKEHLIPRLQLLLIEGFEDRMSFNEFMKEIRESLIQQVKELTESWRRVRKRKRSADHAEERSNQKETKKG